MKIPLLLSIILFLIGTTVSLRAIPILEETKDSPITQEQQAAQREEAGRSISEPTSSDENDEGDLPRQDQLPQRKDPSMDATSASSSGAAGATESPIPITSAEEQHLQTTGPAAAEASFQGRSLATVQKPNGGVVKKGEGTSWRSPALSDAEDLKPFDVIITHNNRAKDIDKRKAAFQQELRLEQIKSPSPESEHRIFALQHLIAVLEKASSYQNAMVNHLQHKDYSSDPRRAALQSSDRLTIAFKINESPNKIERIADQMENDFQFLLFHQTTLNIVQQCIAALPLPEEIPRNLLQIRENLNDVITHQKALIAAKAAYATSLSPPYEERDEATQAVINQRALDCRSEGLLINKKSSSAWGMIKNDPNLCLAFYHQHEAQARQQADKERAAIQPKQQAIDLYTESANHHQQAADAEQAGHSMQAQCLNLAGIALFQAANETRVIQPKQHVIALFTQAADLHQQAAADAEQAGHSRNVATLNAAGSALFNAAEEAQAIQPLQHVIDWFTQSADLYQRAQQVVARGPASDIGDYLEQAGFALSLGANGARKAEPKKQAIDLYAQAADLVKQGAAGIQPAHLLSVTIRMHRGIPSLDPARRLISIGNNLSLAAYEMQEVQPRQQQIDRLLREAEEWGEPLNSNTSSFTIN